MDIKDRSLLLKAASGDETAIRQIWELWSPRLMTYLQSLPDASREDREDLAQEILLKVYKSLRKYIPLYAPATWIYTIAAHTVADWKSKSRKQSKIILKRDCESSAEDPILRIPDKGKTPEAACISREEDDLICDFIRRQSPRDQQILFLTGYEGISGRAAAKVIGMSPDTLRYRLKILRQMLKEELQ